MASLLLHMRLRSTVKRHHCDVCHRMFTNYSVMVLHKRAHFGERPYQCGYCEDRFTCLSQLKSHYKMHKQQNFIANDQFNHSFAPPFTKHDFVHNCLSLEQSSPFGTYSDATFACLSCDRTFADDDALQKHLKRMHSDRSVKKKHPCSLCDYSSDQKIHLREHMVTHTKVKAFKCTHCDKRFTQKGSLTTHVRSIHTKESKHECQICRKVFNHRHHLLTHVRSVHEKIKRFVCVRCGKKFARSSDRTTHMRIHTKDKPYECSLCGKTFTTSGNLSDHEIRNHTRKFPYFCTVCPKGFMTPSQLKKHVERKH